MGICIFSVFCAIPTLVRASKRFGKKEVLAVTCLIEGCFFLGFLFIPSTMMAGGAIYITAVLAGFGMAASFVLPDAILADCIDYDELHTAQRNEGLYTVIESNPQQYVDIIGGVLPSIIAYFTGFASNGGCSCGCGTKCDDDHLRWNCPHDAGYACAGKSFERTLLFGDPDRDAPCTLQNDGTQLTFRLFFLGVPAVCYILAAFFAWRINLSRKACEEVLTELKKRENAPNAKITDPLTKQEVHVMKTDEHFLEHFSKSERARARNATDFVRSLRAGLRARLATWLLLVAMLLAGVIVLKALGEEVAFNTVVTLGCLALAGVFVLIGWDGARLRATYNSKIVDLSASKA